MAEATEIAIGDWVIFTAQDGTVREGSVIWLLTSFVVVKLTDGELEWIPTRVL